MRHWANERRAVARVCDGAKKDARAGIVVMGVHSNVGHDRFPKQGALKGKRVEVVFDYDTTRTTYGVVLRDDAEEPGRMIIRLDDERVILSTECQWRPVPWESH